MVREYAGRRFAMNGLNPHHHQSFEILTNAVEEILNQIGKTFKIDFIEIKYFTELKASFKFE